MQTMANMCQTYSIEAPLYVDWIPSKNISPGKFIPIVVNQAGGLAIKVKRWGWNNNKGNNRLLANLPCDIYKDSLSDGEIEAGNRCLILADSFSAWEASSPSTTRRPWEFQFSRGDKSIIAIGGQIKPILTRSQGTQLSVIVITKNAPVAQRCFCRIPLIIGSLDIHKWLSAKSSINDIHDILANKQEYERASWSIVAEVNP